MAAEALGAPVDGPYLSAPRSNLRILRPQGYYVVKPCAVESGQIFRNMKMKSLTYLARNVAHAGGYLLRLLGHVHSVAYFPCRSGNRFERHKPGVSR